MDKVIAKIYDLPVRSRISGALFLLITCFFISPLQSQDTLTFMHYNLLRYGASGIGGCSPLSPNVKNPYLSTVVSGVMPDIFTANELGDNQLHSSNILTNVLAPLNSAYKKAAYTNNSNSDVTNMLFYNSDKLVLWEEKVIDHSLRDMNVYRLYYNDPGLGSGNDTVFIDVISAHLKAGSNASDETQRATMTAAMMNYLDGLGSAGNYFISGDFNLSGSDETAYQNMVAHTNADTRMFDPVSTPGQWGSSSSFAAVHTQSTRSSGGNDCGSGGGLDDRFDLILCSGYVLAGAEGVSYIPDSYWAYGNDGAHYNQSINSGTNTAVSTNVSNALNALSDHLPVVMDIAVSPMVSIDDLVSAGIPGLEVKVLGNPVEEFAEIEFVNRDGGTALNLQVAELSGRVILERSFQIKNGVSKNSLPLTGTPDGFYLLFIHDEAGRFVVKTLIKR